MRALIIPILFLSMPLAEIAAFILVGREVGVATTLLLVLGSALVGAVLLHVQGLDALRKIQQAAQTGADPGRQLVHGLMILIAAFLLIVPGFISDVIGLLLFIPAVRDLGWSLIKNRLTIVTTGMTRPGTANGSAGNGKGGFSRESPPDPDTKRRPDSQVIDLDADEFSRSEGRANTNPNKRDRLK